MFVCGTAVILYNGVFNYYSGSTMRLLVLPVFLGSLIGCGNSGTDPENITSETMSYCDSPFLMQICSTSWARDCVVHTPTVIEIQRYQFDDKNEFVQESSMYSDNACTSLSFTQTQSGLISEQGEINLQDGTTATIFKLSVNKENGAEIDLRQYYSFMHIDPNDPNIIYIGDWFDSEDQLQQNNRFFGDSLHRKE